MLFSLYKMENLLKEIVNNSKPKRSFSVVVSDNNTRFKTQFKPPIQLDKKKDYEIALINLETYYSFPNVDKSNNCFSYSPGANTQWFDIIIPEGSYHVEDINEFIQRENENKSHYDNANDKVYIEISANINRPKDSYEADFRRYNSINRSQDLIVNSKHQDLTNLKIWLIFLLSRAYQTILILFQVVISMVPHNPQFTRSFQMFLPGIKLSKIRIIFFTFQ